MDTPSHLELCLTYLFVYYAGLDAGLVGLSMTYAMTLMGMFQWGVRQSAEVENQVRTSPRMFIQVCFVWFPVPLLLEKMTGGTWNQFRVSIHIIFFLFLHENVCCGYSLEVPG